MQALRITTLALLLATAGMTQAKTPVTPATPLSDCVDLTPSRQAFGFGTQYLLVQDGDAHYRVSFYGSCDAVGMPQVEINTSGTANRLCPKDTRVTASMRACSVRTVEQIDADRYARYRRLSR
jgi:hypothetical protein